MTDTDCNARKIHPSDDEQKIEDDFDSQIAAWESQKELFFAKISAKKSSRLS